MGTSLVAQWLRICLTMQGTWVRALVWEDPTCRRATAHAPQLLSLRAATTEAREPRARALQRRVAPAHHNQRKPTCSNKDPTQPKIKLIN